MPRSSCKGELIFNPKGEKTACRLRKETKIRRGEQSPIASPWLNLAMDLFDSSSDSEQKEVIMANNNRTLRELAAPNLNQQPLCITFPDFAENVTFELKS